MKLCYLASAISIHTARWANHFSGKGHQVDIVSFEAAKDISETVRVHRLGRRWPLKLHYFWNGNLVRHLLDRIQPDILHAHYASGYGTLGRLTGFHPYIVSVWGSDIFQFANKSPIHRSIITANLCSADRLCSTSRVMADQIRVHCDRPVDVTPFGVDCEQFRPSRVDPMTNNEFVVGIVKGLEPIYGVEHLIRGFAMASKRSRRKMRLIIAGDGSLRKSLEALTHEVGISNQATFLGLISHKDVPTILNQFSVFVAPSIGPESFGVAVIEASACAVPVIVSSIGGLPEVVREGETGLLVPPRDASAIAAALEKLMQDESLRVGLGKEGRKFVLNNYEWSENAARMERVYDTLIN